MAAERNWTHRSKRTPWIGGISVGPIIKAGADWSDAAFVMTFAATPTGSALITLSNATAGSQGVSATFDPDFVHPKTGMIVGATEIVPHITEATLEGLTYDGTNPKTLYFDLLVTPSGEPQRPVLYGTLTVHQGIGD